MTISTETLEKWLSDAKDAVPKWEAIGLTDFYNLANDDPPSYHIANLCPANAIALIEELKQLRSMTHKDEWKKVNIRGVEVEVLGVKK